MEERMKSPLTLLSSLWKDIQRLNPDVKGLKRDIITLERRFEHEGYGFLTIALPALGAALTQGLATGQFTCPFGFLPIKGGAIPRICSGMFSEVFDSCTGKLREDADLGVIKCLREALYLFQKVRLETVMDEELHNRALGTFASTDLIAHRVFIPDREAHLIDSIAKIVLYGQNSKPVEELRYKHGPGAVVEGSKGNQKWSSLTESVRNADFDLYTYGYGDFSVDLTNDSVRAESTDSTEQELLQRLASNRTAKIISVPKNSTSRRTITVEPLLNQFIQQGLNIELRLMIDVNPILSMILALTDQSENQKLALAGSRTNDWATIDLKSASDLLSLTLVKLVFRHHGQFLDRMMDCRTPFAECENYHIELGKFAGMGNALTFPVQSVCFAIICIAAILDQRGEKASYWSVKRAARQLRVYGDDIIVGRKYAHQCVTWLEVVGLKVNHNKSFLEGNFKESCGVDAFKGVDVTPLYLRYRPDDQSTEPSVIEGLVATSNQAWLRGLYSFSTCLADEVESRLGTRLPLVSKKSGSLGWHSRLDAMNPTRWNRRLHQLETRALVLKALKRRDRLDGHAALLKFFHVPLLGRDKDHLEKSHIRFKNRLVRTWVPTRVG
jgi:hypothetical protein